MMSSQFFCFYIVTFCIAGGFAMNCSQCYSVPGKLNPACFNGNEAVKPCTEGKNYCRLQIKINGGISDPKSMIILRDCVRFPTPSSCRSQRGATSCSKACNSDYCNLGMISPADFVTSTTTAVTTVSTNIPSSSAELNATKTEPTSTVPPVKCYSCHTKDHGYNCTTNPSAVGRTEVCGPDKPYCSVSVYSLSGLPGRGHMPPTVERKCAHTFMNVDRPGGIFSMYVGSCQGNLCNNFSVDIRSLSSLVYYYRSREVY